jgi:hypothetical protein
MTGWSTCERCKLCIGGHQFEHFLICYKLIWIYSCKSSTMFCSPVHKGKHLLYIGDESVFSYYIYSSSQDREGANYRIKTALHHYHCLKDYIHLTGENHIPHTS